MNKRSNVTSEELPLRMANDYLFRSVFQSRPKALEGLCRSILHLSPTDKISVTLQNPIELSKRIESKEFILDLAVVINSSVFLNLEIRFTGRISGQNVLSPTLAAVLTT